MLFGNILLDLIVVIGIASGLYIGWHRGFIAVVLKTFAGLFSAVLSLRFFEGLATVLKDKYVLSFVKEGLTEALSDVVTDESAEAMTAAMPKMMSRLASIVGIDLEEMAQKAVESGKNAVASFVETASNSIAQLLSSVAAFLLLFAAFFFVLRVLSIPLSKIIMKLPVIGTANRAIGLLFGALATLIITWIAVLLIGFLDDSIGLGFIEVKDCLISGIFYRFHIFS